MGWSPGNISAMNGACRVARAPFLIAGTIPARTTDDLPLPLGPTTAKNLDPGPTSFNRATRRCASSRRPKKSRASASVKARRPL
jgi:hypothetical protein